MQCKDQPWLLSCLVIALLRLQVGDSLRVTFNTKDFEKCKMHVSLDAIYVILVAEISQLALII